MGFKGVVGALFLVIVGPFLLLSLYGLAVLGHAALFGETAAGIVVTTASGSTSRGFSLRPVVRFADSKGQEHRIEGLIGLRGRGSGERRVTHAIGERVRVVYPQGQPEKAMMADTKSILWQVFLSLFLSAFVFIGGWAVRSDHRQQREDGWATRRF